jgi:hypothetical protein
MDFDVRRAYLKGPDLFLRFPIHGEGVPLATAGLPPETELLVFERDGQRRGLLKAEMAYHHVAQGKLAGRPYLVSF